MGTSTSNPGQKGRTPLVPSWLDDYMDNNIPPDEQKMEPPKFGDPNRFRQPRSDFTTYLRSGGENTSRLRRAGSSYVRYSLGGSQNATVRLGAARTSATRLLSVLSSFSTNGIYESSRRFGFRDLVGKPASEVFLHIVDFVCPNGGSEEEGIARDSYIEALLSLPEIHEKNIEDLTSNEFLSFFQLYMANIIKQRLINDIGTKSISLPENIAQAELVQLQITDYIKGAVSDAISDLHIEIEKIDSLQTKGIVDSIYKRAYDIIASMED